MWLLLVTEAIHNSLETVTQICLVIVNPLCLYSEAPSCKKQFLLGVWRCRQSAVLSFRSLRGELHHLRKMIESLSLLHFHSFLLEWINLYPTAQAYVCSMQIPIWACAQFCIIAFYIVTFLVWSIVMKELCVLVFVFRRWYALMMSGVGENSSDPARAESRKRKECSVDLIGPR